MGGGCKRRRMSRVLLVALVVEAAILAGCSVGTAKRTPAPTPTATMTPAGTPTLPPARYGVLVRRSLAYGPRPGETLDVCAPEGAAGTRPAIVLLHGGGFVNGDKADVQDQCSYLASQGFVVANANYRLAPANSWPDQVVDAQLAVRWLRAQASQLGVDPTRVCSDGVSAGANLAVFLGILGTIHPGDEAGLYANESPRVRCVVDAFGPVDLPALLQIPQYQILAQTLLGPNVSDEAAIAHDASPLFFVTSRSAPALIIQGARDTFVPPQQSRELQQALQRDGVLVQYISYDGGHAFSGLTQHQVGVIEAQAFLFLETQLAP